MTEAAAASPKPALETATIQAAALFNVVMVIADAPDWVGPRARSDLPLRVGARGAAGSASILSTCRARENSVRARRTPASP